MKIVLVKFIVKPKLNFSSIT